MEFDVKLVPEEGESLKQKKIFPSARPQGGALRMCWHTATWEICKNLSTEQQEETEAISGWQVIGFPPVFLFPQIFFKSWPLSSSSSPASSEKIGLPIASLETEVCWHEFPQILFLSDTNWALSLLKFNSFLKYRTASNTFPAFQTVIFISLSWSIYSVVTDVPWLGSPSDYLKEQVSN